MIAAAAERGWLDGRRVMTEAMTAIVRAGAGIVISYAAAGLAMWALSLPFAFVLDFLGMFLIGLGAFWLEDTSGLRLLYSRATALRFASEGGDVVGREVAEDFAPIGTPQIQPGQMFHRHIDFARFEAFANALAHSLFLFDWVHDLRLHDE